MSDPGIPTFDQLQIFLAVVESGTFAGAGRKLNRATSVISYGISNLEAQLGIELFDREATRRPAIDGSWQRSAGRGPNPRTRDSTACAPK